MIADAITGRLLCAQNPLPRHHRQRHHRQRHHHFWHRRLPEHTLRRLLPQRDDPATLGQAQHVPAWPEGDRPRRATAEQRGEEQET